MQELKPITGYDNNGTVFDAGDFILRKINPDYFEEVQNIYNFYNTFKLNNSDFVSSELDIEEKRLKHKKLVTSYPYEWTANMFKDALLFHLELFLKLDTNGYTLKDGLPSNVLFENTNPVFIDFLSLLKKENLQKETWLVEDTKYNDVRFAVFDKMFTPFFIIPFLAMAKKDYELARKLLLEKACNLNNISPSWNDVIGKLLLKLKLKNLFRKLRGKPLIGRNIYLIYELIKYKHKIPFNEFCEQLITIVKNTDVTPPQSNYSSYYAEKKEDFVFDNQTDWKEKQINVYETIKKYSPKTVLDLGANTGWFSLLAERNGSRVISVEIDEASVDNLYRYAKNEKLNILPLQIGFENFNQKYFGTNYDKVEYPEYRDRDFKNNPLFDSVVNRLKCDMTMCLALAHHLVLGMGLEIDEVMKTLASLTNEVLILEFICLDDNLIKSEPDFFKNLNKYNQETYNIERFIDEGRKYFENIEILDSHPNTRKIIIFKKDSIL